MTTCGDTSFHWNNLAHLGERSQGGSFLRWQCPGGSLAAQRVTLINSKDESVSVYFDIDTHLPIKKSYTWRDPADNERNVEEETFDGYRLAQGIMTPSGSLATSTGICKASAS